MGKETEHPGEGRKRRVVLVDDHPVVREGFAGLINHEADMEVCGQAESAARAMDVIARAKPDLAIVDISLKGINGLELIKQIRARFPEVRLLVLSMHDETLYAERSLRAGARGYVMKQERTESVMRAIRQTLRGDLYLSDKMRDKMLYKLVAGTRDPGNAGIASLSDRELEIFTLIGHGKGTRQIAKELNISVKTVETHRAHIKEKLRLESAMMLVRQAVQWVENESKTR